MPLEQTVALLGQTSPFCCVAGPIWAPAGGAGVQPLPSAVASKSTDSRLVPIAPNIEVITQFCDVVREPLLPGVWLPQVPKPGR